MFSKTNHFSRKGLHFPVPLSQLRRVPSSDLSASSYADATPPLIAQLYGLPTTPAKNSLTSQAVAGWQAKCVPTKTALHSRVVAQHQSFNEGDLRRFQNDYSLPIMPVRRVFGHNTDFPHLESNLVSASWVVVT